MTGPVETRIREKLTAALSPVHLEVENESYKHSVPSGSETHFKVVVVSERFAGLSRVDRSRLIHEQLAEELQSGVHALALRTHLPSEWKGESFETPQCHSKTQK